MGLKLFFLTTEITPFANATSLADFSANVPLLLQAKDHDIRIMHPKYGFISERKFILREVIRLREIPFVFNGEEQMTSAKSAFIPKTRVQVYFLEQTEWFKPLSNLIYKSKNGRVLGDNDLRYSYYSNASLATLPHLFWRPNFVICNGWQSAFVPGMFKQQFEGLNEFYKSIKTVMVIHDLNEYCNMERSDLVRADISIHSSLKGTVLNVYDVAAFEADAIIIMDKPSEKNSTKLLKRSAFKANKKKVTILTYNDDESPAYNLVAVKIDKVIAKLST